MSRWFRFYDEALNDPKVQRLAPDLFKVWVNFLCLASKGDGLVMRSDVTFGLRFTDEKETDFFIGKLIELDLIDDRGDVLAPHNWRKRQYKSDCSTLRVKQFRKRQGNVSETPPDTEQSRDRTEVKPPNGGDDRDSGIITIGSPLSDSPYAFEGEVIKLKQKNFDQWKRANPRISLESELLARDAWLAQQPEKDRVNWFISTSKYLANRNMEAKAKEPRAIQWKTKIEGVL